MPKPKQPIEEDLKELRRQLLEMGVAAEEMVGDAVQALVKQNTELARRVEDRDEQVDRMEKEVELQCLRLLSRKALTSSELRHTIDALKIATDIERIADHAVDIARLASTLAVEAIYKPLVDIPQLAEVSLGMLHATLDAFVRRDYKLAPTLIAADDEADALHHRMSGELQSHLRSDLNSTVQATTLLFVVHYLERVCDHCTNIAERVGAPAIK